MPAVVRHHWRASTPALASISSRTTQRDRANGARLHEEVSSASAARESLRRGVAREIIQFVVKTTNEFHNNEILYIIKCISYYFHFFVLRIRKNRSEIKERYIEG